MHHATNFLPMQLAHHWAAASALHPAVRVRHPGTKQLVTAGEFTAEMRADLDRRINQRGEAAKSKSNGNV